MKIVCLSSGGLDSTLMMKMLLNKDHEIHPLFIDYGQLSHEKEWECCKNMCKHLSLSPKNIQIQGFGRSIKSGITDKEKDIKDAFLPNRNLLFLLVGSSWAYQNDIYTVSIGLIKNPIFPDQTKIFIEDAERCIQESLACDMKTIAPLINLDKRDVYNLSLEFKLPLNETYYCHSGSDVPCGQCLACKEHILTKKELGIK